MAYKRNEVAIPELLAHPETNAGIQDKNGTTALILACLSEKINSEPKPEWEHLKLNKEQKPEFNNLIYHHSDKATDEEINNLCKLLSHSDVDVNTQDDNGLTPLMLACIDNPDFVPYLLNHPDIDVNAQDPNGKTALMWACEYNQEIASALLNHPDIDVNTQDNNGKTALIQTLSQKFNTVELVHNLLKHPDIDSNIQDNNGKTALIMTCENKCSIPLDYSSFRPKSRTDYYHIIPDLLKNTNADSNIQDNNGRTALMQACKNDNAEAFKELLKQPNIGLNVCDNHADTALTIACKLHKNAFHYKSMIRGLIQCPNIDLTQKNNDDQDVSTILKTYKPEFYAQLEKDCYYDKNYPDINQFNSVKNNIQDEDSQNYLSKLTHYFKKFKS